MAADTPFGCALSHSRTSIGIDTFTRLVFSFSALVGRPRLFGFSFIVLLQALPFRGGRLSTLVVFGHQDRRYRTISLGDDPEGFAM